MGLAVIGTVHALKNGSPTKSDTFFGPYDPDKIKPIASFCYLNQIHVGELLYMIHWDKICCKSQFIQ